MTHFRQSGFDRRALIIGGAGALVSTSVPAFAACKAGPIRSVSSCAQGCDSPFDTFNCQMGVLFPSSNGILRGAVAGAVLGGVIAFAAGDVSILAGVVVGGVVGGLTVAANQYFSHRMAFAQGDYRSAHDEMELDKDGDETRLTRFSIVETIGILTPTIAAMARDLGVHETRLEEVRPVDAPRSFRTEARPLLRQVQYAQRGHRGTNDTFQVSQTAMRNVAQYSQRPVVPVSPRLEQRQSELGGQLSGLFRLARNVAVALNVDTLEGKG